MASKWSIGFFVAILAATFYSSEAQKIHVVGGALGWTVPPGGPIAYTTWASQQTFTRGDILVFNYTTGLHDVAEVNKAAYDACNTQSPISIDTNGPSNVTLTTAGEHYYICTFGRHCALGMKLAINVSASTSTTPPPQPTPSSPAPSPVTVPSPAPVTAPAPVATRTPRTYVVGDALGWTVPPGGPIAYQTWAANKAFFVGDILLFNFLNGNHNVAQLTSKADFDSCNTSAVSTPITASPAMITLTTSGEHFYFCTFPRHCSLGQKLAINVTGTNAPTPSSSEAQKIHVVGGALGWTVPPGGPIAYTTWASQQTFTRGDILVFNYTTGLHDVAEVNKAAYDACNTQSPISIDSNGPSNVTLTTAGEHYYICTFGRHCALGMKLAINVSASTSTTPPPQPTPSSPAPSPVTVPSPAPVTAPAPVATRTPRTYVVGDALGWTVPPSGPIAYQTWAANKAFFVGDILLFNFLNGNHNVAQLTSKADFDSCNTSAVSTPITASPARITLTTSGEHFYFCTFPRHCSLGQKLAINVTGTNAPTPSSSVATPPSGGGVAPSSPTPTSGSVPPSPSSAPIALAASLPIILLSIALAILY